MNEKSLNKIGYKLGDYQGSGQYGNVYSIQNGNVLKITTDASEANSSARLIHKETKNICKIFRVFRLKSEISFFYIEQEKLQKIKNMDFMIYDNFNCSEDTVYAAPKLSVDYAIEKSDYFRINIYNILMRLFRADITSYYLLKDTRISNTAEKNLLIDIEIKDFANFIKELEHRKFFLSMLNAYEELKKYRIKWPDFHSKNVMIDQKGDYKIIDIGISKSPKSDIEVLPEMKQIIETIHG